MSNPTPINAKALEEYLAYCRRENLTNATICAAMRRLCDLSGEMDEDDLAGLALELEALAVALGERLNDFARLIDFSAVEHRCAALADLDEIRQAEGGNDAE